MKTIYKYPIEIGEDIKIIMPKDSRPLTVQTENGRPYVWVLVDPTTDCVPHQFYIMGAGHLRDDIDDAEYVGTFLTDWLVFHLFYGGRYIPW